MKGKKELDEKLQAAIQSYWNARASNKAKQLEGGIIDNSARGEVTGGTQMGALEALIADILCEAGLDKLDVRTRTALELPGYYRATKKWDLIVVSEGKLVLAMEFKSQAGQSIGNNVNNRTEEALGSASDLWVAFREQRFGKAAVAPFLGYFFLLEDNDTVNKPVANAEPYFNVDPVFYAPAPGVGKRKGWSDGVSYAKRYETLCRRLVLERLYNSACFVMAKNAKPTVITQPAEDLTFSRFVAALRGHVVTFVESQRK